MSKSTVLLLLALLTPVPVHGQAQQVVRAAEGFVLAIPSGWREAADLGGVAGLTRTDGSEIFNERTAFFDRALAPREGPEGVTPAAEAHRRGLEFARQGAWREAESAFHDAERKNDKIPEYKLSAAFAYLKTHKPNDAYKRYEDFYKKDPAHARALAGMIAAREEAQLYRDAVTLWMRYVRLPHQGEAATEAQALVHTSTAFSRMKTRLSALPPAPDATGVL